MLSVQSPINEIVISAVVSQQIAKLIKVQMITNNHDISNIDYDNTFVAVQHAIKLASGLLRG